VTASQCRACTAPAPDTVLCWDCAKTLHRLLHDLADDIVELTTQLTRQAKTGSRYGSRSSTTPVPYDTHASEVLDDVRTVLVDWTKVACEVEGDWPADTLAGMLRRLRRTNWATHEAADELLDELDWTHRQVIACIDSPEARRYLGPCGTILLGADQPCAGDVIAVGNRAPRCRDCRATHDVDERLAWIAEQTADLLAPAGDIALWLTSLGYPTKPALIATWVARGKLLAHGHDRDRHPVYRVSDARALAEAKARRDASSRAVDRSHSA